MYTITYLLKTGKKQSGAARDAASALEKIRLYRAAGITEFRVTDGEGRTITLDQLPTLADLGH